VGVTALCAEKSQTKQNVTLHKEVHLSLKILGRDEQVEFPTSISFLTKREIKSTSVKK